MSKGFSSYKLPRERVEVDILEQPSKGLFGIIGSKEAKVVLQVKPDAADEAEQFLHEIGEAIGMKLVY